MTHSNISTRPDKSRFPHDRAKLGATTIMEIVQDSNPDIAQSERVYDMTVDRIAGFLRGRDAELETDVLRQFNEIRLCDE